MGLLQVVVFLALGSYSKWVNPPNCGLREDSGRRNLITNGQLAEKYSFPWQVGLNLFGANESWCGFENCGLYIHSCGGTILNKDWILTAAHCVSNSIKYEGEDEETAVMVDPKDWVVIAGEYNYTDDSDTDVRQVIGYDAVIIHPDWDWADMHHNDVALIKLNKSLELSSEAPWKVNSVCLPTTGKKKYGEEILASGWGVLDSEFYDTPEHLHWNSFILRNDAYCEALSGTVFYDRSSSICFSKYEGNPDTPDAKLHDTGEGACYGDSGGPAVQKHADGRYYSEGVCSKGFFCGNIIAPVIYAETRVFVDWIDDMITKYPNIPESKFARRPNATVVEEDLGELFLYNLTYNLTYTPEEWIDIYTEPKWTGANCTESQITNDFSYAYCGGEDQGICIFPLDTEACAEGFDMCKEASDDIYRPKYRCYPTDGIGAPRICEQCFTKYATYFLGECSYYGDWDKFSKEFGLTGTSLYADHVDNCTTARNNVQKQVECVKHESKSGCCSDSNCKWSDHAQLCFWESLIDLDDNCQDVSVECPGYSFDHNSYCDCDGDCKTHADTWCSCEEARECCGDKGDSRVLTVAFVFTLFALLI